MSVQSATTEAARRPPPRPRLPLPRRPTAEPPSRTREDRPPRAARGVSRWASGLSPSRAATDPDFFSSAEVLPDRRRSTNPARMSSAAITSISASRRRNPPGRRAGCGRKASRCMWRRRSGASAPSSGTWPTRVRNGSPPRSGPATTCWRSRTPGGGWMHGIEMAHRYRINPPWISAWRRARGRACWPACTADRGGALRRCGPACARGIAQAGPGRWSRATLGGGPVLRGVPDRAAIVRAQWRDLRALGLLRRRRSASMTRAHAEEFDGRASTPWRRTSSAGTPGTGRSMTSFRIPGCATWRAPRTTACTSCSCGRCRSDRAPPGAAGDGGAIRGL